MSTIHINNVSKSFGSIKALKNVSLTLESDTIYGLLGQNDAGKTTLLNIITNKMFANAGEVLIDVELAEENDRAQAKIYCMTEKNVHPWDLKVKEGFRWAREFNPGFDTEYAYKLANKFDLDIGKKIKSLSKGYNSIFKLILTLASGAPIIIFDEPVLGLDTAHRELFYRELIAYYSYYKNSYRLIEPYSLRRFLCFHLICHYLSHSWYATFVEGDPGATPVALRAPSVTPISPS